MNACIDFMLLQARAISAHCYPKKIILIVPHSIGEQFQLNQEM